MVVHFLVHFVPGLARMHFIGADTIVLCDCYSLPSSPLIRNGLTVFEATVVPDTFVR